MGQPGPDGELDTEIAYLPYVPAGRSIWEIGAGERPGTKATSDYKERTEAIPESIRKTATFIFVTPLSATKTWQYTWKETSQNRWRADRLKRQDWANIQIIDGTCLVDWVARFPPVEAWLAREMNLPVKGIETLEKRWLALKSIGEPPPLPPQVFLSGREEAQGKLNGIFGRTVTQLQLDTHFPEQAADFVAACIEVMEPQAKIDVLGRSLVVSDPGAWEELTTLRDAHVFVADFSLDGLDSGGAKFLDIARRAGHAVIYGGAPGGVLDLNRAELPNPREHEVKEALEKGGYPEERARVLARKCEGNMTSLLRCLQSLSTRPEWAEASSAAELALGTKGDPRTKRLWRPSRENRTGSGSRRFVK